MAKALEFKVKRVHKLNSDSKMKAFVDIAINDILLIKGLRIIDGPNGIFVSMPQDKGKDNVWYDSVLPLNKEVRQEISNIVLKAYESEA